MLNVFALATPTTSWMPDAMVLANLLIVALLLVVGGVVLWLHVRLDQLKQSAAQMPTLSDDFMHALAAVRHEMQALKTEMDEVIPALQKPMQQARHMQQDLEFLTHRASKVVERLDSALTHAKVWEEKHAVGSALPAALAAATEGTVAVATMASMETLVVQKTVPPIEAPAEAHVGTVSRGEESLWAALGQARGVGK
ncbi:MAG: DUF6468 domain-containing protein [Alphaproteobacteria bacterium]